jgi:hypothetical protein
MQGGVAALTRIAAYASSTVANSAVASKQVRPPSMQRRPAAVSPDLHRSRFLLHTISFDLQR